MWRFAWVLVACGDPSVAPPPPPLPIPVVVSPPAPAPAPAPAPSSHAKMHASWGTVQTDDSSGTSVVRRGATRISPAM